MKQEKKQEKNSKKKSKNHELMMITYLFTGLFVLLTGYLVYFNAIKSEDIINNPYNARQDSFADRVIRGKILSDDGTVLAETKVGNDNTEVREYPYGEYFAHVVGYSTKGKTGLEAIGNYSLLTSNAFFGERFLNEVQEEKSMGDNLVTTLNLDVQLAAYNALGDHKGAIIAMEPDTGKILAMVSKPDYDPNTIVQDWEELNDDSAENDSPLYNRATQGLYPPGSTFKIITLLEYLKEHDMNEDFSFTCTGSFEAGNQTVNCYNKKAHGKLDLKTAFAKSCNGAFSQIGLELDRTSVNRLSDSLLFQQELPLELPYSKSSFNWKEDFTPADKMLTAIGQGETLVSPMHMALIVSSIANGGVLMEPYLIDRVENYNGDLVKKYMPSTYGSLMSASEAAILTDYMTAVIESGTGTKLKGLSYTVAGKTGSAEFSSDKSKSHSWFVGFSNVDDPELVVCVLIEEAGTGSEYAVPAAKKVFEAYHKTLS